MLFTVSFSTANTAQGHQARSQSTAANSAAKRWGSERSWVTRRPRRRRDSRSCRRLREKVSGEDSKRRRRRPNRGRRSQGHLAPQGASRPRTLGRRRQRSGPSSIHIVLPACPLEKIILATLYHIAGYRGLEARPTSSERAEPHFNLFKADAPVCERERQAPKGRVQKSACQVMLSRGL